MAHSASSNSRGFSLVEVLIAIAFLAIVAMALMQTSIVIMQQNMQNALREEAVRIAEQRMKELQNTPFDTDVAATDIDLIATGGADLELPSITRRIRNYTITYTTWKNIVSVNAYTKQVTVTAKWTYRGKEYNQGVMSIIGRPSS